MSSDIQFGELEQSEPQRAIRPDQDAHFATSAIGRVGDDELLIFVDLDVMRDMEAHAKSNTRVELGGVMLGQQQVDDQGRPFVVITECLRAEHYEATSVNFKFTHETWSQITRQRSGFRPDLAMVGWYHTHPGLTVFLSGMDLFICNNFFNRPLDVALVIDPCGQDRGWFQWTDDDSPVTHRTGGFVLTTSRLRQGELDQFSRIYNKEPMMNLDPRYSGVEMAGNTQPLVHLMDTRKPIHELAIIGMLVIQFLLFCVLAWRFLDSNETQAAAANQAKIVEAEGRLDSGAAEPRLTVREEAYREVLQTLASRQAGDPNLADRLVELKTEQAMLGANLAGQMALVKQLQSERNEALAQWEGKSADAENLESQLVKTRSKLGDSQRRIDLLSSQLEGKQAGTDADSDRAGDVVMPWWWLLIGTLLIGGVGAALGVVWGRREASMDRPVPLEEGAPGECEDEGLEFSTPPARSPGGDPDDPVKVSLTIDGDDSGQ